MSGRTRAVVASVRAAFEWGGLGFGLGMLDVDDRLRSKRFDAEVEAALYFCLVEALPTTNGEGSVQLARIRTRSYSGLRRRSAPIRSSGSGTGSRRSAARS